ATRPVATAFASTTTTGDTTVARLAPAATAESLRRRHPPSGDGIPAGRPGGGGHPRVDRLVTAPTPSGDLAAAAATGARRSGPTGSAGGRRSIRANVRTLAGQGLVTRPLGCRYQLALVGQTVWEMASPSHRR